MVAPRTEVTGCRPWPMYFSLSSLSSTYPQDTNSRTGSDYLSCFEAPAKRELEYCKRFAKPRLCPERYLRELYHLKEMPPTVHIDLLSDYLKLAPHLNVPLDHPFAYPTLRHPNLSPDNILVDSSYNITAIIEWQNAVALPLSLRCCTRLLPKLEWSQIRNPDET